MTKANMEQLVKDHNDSIDNFINVELKKQLRIKGNKINANQWFEAQEIIRNQNFYQKGSVIQKELQAEGFDIRMNMQSNKLVIY